MIDAGIRGSTVRLQNTFMEGARNKSQSGGLNLKNVVRHLPGRDASLRVMYASHGVPVEASTT